MEKAFSLLDIWKGCPNDGAPGHLKIHWASKARATDPWVLKGGGLQCPIPEGEDFDAHWALMQEWTGLLEPPVDDR